MSKKNAVKGAKNKAPVQVASKSKIKAPEAPPVVVAKTVKEKRAEFIEGAQNAGAFIAKGAGADVLGGRIGARTHSIHAVLLDASRLSLLLTTKEITTRATNHLGAPCNATASHLNTMSERKLLIRENGAWRLTDAALDLCGAKWGADTKAPKIKKTKK